MYSAPHARIADFIDQLARGLIVVRGVHQVGHRGGRPGVEAVAQPELNPHPGGARFLHDRILIGDRVIARGEVVIVGGNYGVRIMDLISSAERARAVGR